ncbi:MAG: thiamine pyrophosphate-dependent dehydrogenase E1 component subunit alpha [Gemmatimonadales bacterium]|nr:thiamine pyrophosphate-dependent dehydrogenase E1 component subunit alpha [Gemmatimonadales bacterium]
MTAVPAEKTAPPIPAGLTADQLRAMYRYLRLTRTLEEKLVALYRQTKVIGGLFRSLGQEGESVGSSFALQPGDIMSPLIRNLGSMLVMGATPTEVLRQYMAKAESPTRGRELNIHFNDLERGFLGQISHLGDLVCVMAGITLSFRLRREPRVGMVYIGDGAMSTGAFHEGINFAAVQRCPLVIVCEHNGWAYSTPTRVQTKVERLAHKAAAYGLPGVTCDGNDVLAVYETAKAAVDAARRGEGPTLLEVVTYRRKGHAEHDNQSYQPKDEIAEWAARDPIERYRSRLLEAGWAGEAELAAIDAAVQAEVDAATEACEGEPFPPAEGALDGVLADPPRAEVEWYRRLPHG